MATIVFLIEHEEGHLNPTFRLARKLAARGHRPVYLGPADGGDFIRAQGFEFLPILEDVFPPGTARTLRAVTRDGVPGESPSGAGREAEIAAAAHGGPDSKYRRSWRGLLLSPDLDRTMRELAPDLFVLTSFYAPHALVLRQRYHRSAVLLTTILRTFPKSEYASAVGGLLVDAKEARAPFAALLAGASGTPLSQPELARRVLVQILRMRELILCPVDLELPGHSHEREPEVHYVEATVDLERRSESPFPWPALDPAKRLLYVSLGSQSHRLGREGALRFFSAVAAVFADRPDWQVVLSTGGLLDCAEIPPIPGGIVTPWAPQIELLARAALAITHAGLGTIKECIVRGVPMITFPFLLNDQQDNARRVVHHGLGVSGDLRSVSAGTLANFVGQTESPVLRESVARMCRRFLDIETSGIGVRRIEELLVPAVAPPV